MLETKVVTTFHYGHLDDPIPLKDRIIGMVICDLLTPPWKQPLIGIPVTHTRLSWWAFVQTLPGDWMRTVRKYAYRREKKRKRKYSAIARKKYNRECKRKAKRMAETAFELGIQAHELNKMRNFTTLPRWAREYAQSVYRLEVANGNKTNVL